MKAIWNNVVVADSDDTVVVEGNHYFPAAALKREYVQPSATTSVCPWKGYGELLLPAGERRRQCGCRLVLP